jgi:hypothetical protein
MSFPPTIDRGYLNLISHLNASNIALPLRTVTASVAYYLPRAQPSATPLAAIVVTSPLFRLSGATKTDTHRAYDALDALLTALRHTVHIKLKLLHEEPTGIWVRGVNSRFAEWVGEVVKGLDGAQPVVKLACLAGLLTGLEDLRKEADTPVGNGRVRGRVEEEAVIALAEVVDSASSTSTSQDPWEKEFRSRARSAESMLSSCIPSS